MARAQPRYACQQCGAVHAKWTGRCDGCGAWNSLIEELPREAVPKGLDKGGGRALGFVGLTGPSMLPPRRRTGIAEWRERRGHGLLAECERIVRGEDFPRQANVKTRQVEGMR